MSSKPIGDDFNRRGVGKHTRLKSANIIYSKNRVKLRGNEIGRNGVDRRNSRWVLRRQRRKDSAAMKPIGMERAQIRLNAGVATGITSGDCKTTRRYCTVHD